ncbi:hypothetical protein FHR99_002102 [Litorivivens lipolytica]|uniref:Right handed beta helix region n=1 Tax=Litorivivens lipolytica TaxID=1524264 RepID=A0A7W4Z7E5_9GAMM|nr:hypothetical protein [Litorivivens lipolytica]MBB3047836.1 hypothetical protein [Litorivivens lipolytica]
MANRNHSLLRRFALATWTLAALSLLASPVPDAEAKRPALPERQAATTAISPGNIIKLSAGQDFQDALNTASPGDVILLTAGATFSGPFTLPAKPGTDETTSRWITIRSSASPPMLPEAGQRVSPAHAGAMATLTSSRGAIISTQPGARFYRFIGIKFTPASSSDGVWLKELVRLDNHTLSSPWRNTVPQARHFIFERCYFHGDARVGTRRGVVLNAGSTAILDSHFSDFKIRGEDSQAIVGWNGTGPYLIRNNYLEAAGENIMFGGGDPSVENLVPSDITITGNHLTKPLSWRSSDRWTIKNLLELKNARRVLIQGNLLEYNWPQAQNGFSVLFTVRNQDGSAPWSTVEDITFSHNIIRHVASGINILGHDDHHPSQQTRRILIHNNVFYDIGGDWGEGRLLQLLEGAADISFTHNTALVSGNVLTAEGRPNPDLIFTRNIVSHNAYGIVGRDKSPGSASLAFYFPNARINRNIFIGGSARFYPGDNYFPKTITRVGFADPKSHDYRLAETGVPDAGASIAELCGFISNADKPVFCEQ